MVDLVLTSRLLRGLLAVGGVVAIAVAWLAATPDPAYGCSCADQPLADYADEIDRAFIGQLVIRTEHSYTADNGVALVFDVERVYKGPIESRIEVFTHAQESACGLKASGLGSVGIVASEWQGKMSVNSCSSPATRGNLEVVFGAGSAPEVDAEGGESRSVVIALIAAVSIATAVASFAVVAVRRSPRRPRHQ